MKEQYKITCNKKQLLLIASALEMDSRMRVGQLRPSCIPPIYEKMYSIDLEINEQLQEKRKVIEQKLEELREILWPNGEIPLGEDNKSELGYEMYKQILYQIEKEEQERCSKVGEQYQWNVHSYKPCLKYTQEPNIKIEKT